MRQCYLSEKHFLHLRVNLIKVCLIIIVSMLLFPIFSSFNAEATHNPHLFVSAENPVYDNHFEGSMVIEVVVSDPDYNDVSEAEGEPDVTLNGNDLRMVQATDGKWYAYFANIDAAKRADQIVLNAGPGAAGKSLDFGVFCSSSTDPTVLGTGFSETEGVAVPGRIGLSDFTNGNTPFSACTGSPTGGNENNVVRNAKSVNTNPSVPTGQIGIDVDAWPIIQLFSFSDVEIKYNRAGGIEKAQLEYDDIPNISSTTDREGYPNNAEVFLTVNDIQLNQDPTDEDSWTFNINSTEATFYQAFTESGSDSGNNSPGLINLVPNLSSLGFEDNGELTMNLGNIAKLKTNGHQPTLSVSDTVNVFSQIVTLVESEPDSGIFESFDFSNESIIGILGNAPRGQSAIIQYNDKSTSIVAGPSTASISMNPHGRQFNPGQQAQVTVVDSDQNVNSASRDILNDFNSTVIIPSLQLGDPVTLEKTSSLKFYTVSTEPLSDGFFVDFSVPDKNSDRLIINTAPIGTSAFEKISLNMGITAGTLQSLFIDDSLQNNFGTNWLNFDLRSFAQQLGISSFSDTSMSLHFGGLPGTTIVQILDPGDISSGIGLIQLDDADISAINSVSSSSSVFLVINFDSSNNTVSTGMISNETDSQPIVIDFFSFGQKNNQEINNAIYRFELEETANNSGIFVGTIEYAVTNQVNILDPSLITSLRTIDDRIKFLVNNRLINDKGINIAYSDIAQVGITISTSSKSDILTHSGSVSVTSTTFRFGQPVFFVLNDPDLNLKHDTIETYLVVNDPNSPNVDTVGTSGGDILLEILIKDIRYQRCTINGVQYGGLASTGFTLTETGPSSGIFEGIFKMPTQICDKTGTKLITTAGGSLDAKYYDFRDYSGEQNIFSLTSFDSSSTTDKLPKLNSQKLVIPKYNQKTEVTLNGKIDNYIQGAPIDITLIGPDSSSEKFSVFATQKGAYKVVFTLYHNSLPGNYKVSVNYHNSHIGDELFQVSKYLVPEWIKNNARWWSSDQISDSEFISGIEHLVEENIIVIPDSVKSQSTGQNIPFWMKNSAEWWSQDIVSDDEFVAALEFLVKNGIIRL